VNLVIAYDASGLCQVGGSYGATSAETLGAQLVTTATPGTPKSPTTLTVSFIQTTYVASQTQIEVDDLQLH
jgi:hypothetical protein